MQNQQMKHPSLHPKTLEWKKNIFVSNVASKEWVCQGPLPLCLETSQWVFTDSYFVPNSVQKSGDKEANKQDCFLLRGSV